MAATLGHNRPVIVAVNRLIARTKMVKFGIDGKDIHIGADILVDAALSEAFHDASGKYFDNDKGCFADPHPDAMILENVIISWLKWMRFFKEKAFILRTRLTPSQSPRPHTFGITLKREYEA